MTSKEFDDLTCIIPTHNRAPFLRRQLAYIDSVSLFPHTLVVDSSGTDHRPDNQESVSEVSKQFVKYVHHDLPFYDKLITSLRNLRSKYVVFCADDDTLNPSGVAECLQALKSNPQCRGVIGRAYILNTSSNRLSIARGHSILDEDPLDRIRGLSRNWFSTFYAIHHRKDLLQQLTVARDSIDITQSRLLNELLVSLLAISAGTLLYVDCDYLSFQIHDSNYSKTSSHFRDPADYPALRGKLVSSLATYVSDHFPQTSARCMIEIEAIVHRFLGLQKLPGHPAKRLQRTMRKFQRRYREIVGVHREIGWLETKRLRFDLNQIRSNELRMGAENSLTFPVGITSSHGQGFANSAA